MLPRVIFAALLALVVMAQATLLPMAGVIGIKPDLVLVLLLLWGAVRAPREGLLWAFAAGLLLDLLTLAPPGVNALALLPVVVVGWFSRTRAFQSGLFFPLLMALAASVAHDLVLVALGPLLGGGASPLAVLRLGVLGALLNMLVMPPLYVLIQLLDRWIGWIEADVRA